MRVKIAEISEPLHTVKPPYITYSFVHPYFQLDAAQTMSETAQRLSMIPEGVKQFSVYALQHRTQQRRGEEPQFSVHEDVVADDTGYSITSDPSLRNPEQNFNTVSTLDATVETSQTSLQFDRVIEESTKAEDTRVSETPQLPDEDRPAAGQDAPSFVKPMVSIPPKQTKAKANKNLTEFNNCICKHQS